MKIRLTDIPAAGLPVSEILPQDSINQRLAEGRDVGIRFIEGLPVELTVYKSASGAETKGTVKTRYLQPCARCADGVERELELQTNYILQPRPQFLDKNEEEQFEDDIGISYYEGEHVDLEDLIQESIILSLSIYWHPDEDAKGACVLCHQQVRAADPVKKVAPKGASLGELLKKAGV